MRIIKKYSLNYFQTKENVLLKFGDKPEFRFNTREVKREDLLEIFKTMFDKLLGK